MARFVAAVSIVDAIAEDLRARIFSGDITRDASLTEAEIANQYGVSRPTGKAATEKLVSEGLLERRANKSTRVVHLGPDDVRDIYTTRARLEKIALHHLASTGTVPPDAVHAQRELVALDGISGRDTVEPDMRFHMALIDSIDSPRISRMYGSLVSHVKLCMAQIQDLQLVTPERIIREHQHLLDLIVTGKGDEASHFIDEHLSRPRERLVAALGGTPGPEAELPSSLDSPIDRAGTAHEE